MFSQNSCEMETCKDIECKGWTVRVYLSGGDEEKNFVSETAW